MTDPGLGLVAGVDGGNSKTDVVIADTTGVVRGTARGAGTHPHIVGVGTTVAQLAELVDVARADAGLDPSVELATAVLYIANFDLDETLQEARTAAIHAGLASTVVVGNDTMAVLRAGAPAARTTGGIAVTAGAGINAIGIDPDGRQERFLAMGELTGDWGGGIDLGCAALQAAVRSADGRGVPTVLTQEIPAFFGRASIEEVALWLVDAPDALESLLKLPPVLYSAADRGDDVAWSIMQRAGDEVATMVGALAARLGLDRDGPDLPVVLGGGTLRYAPQRLIARIQAGLIANVPRGRAVVLNAPPVLGAVLAGLDELGADPAAGQRLRDSISPESSTTSL